MKLYLLLKKLILRKMHLKFPLSDARKGHFHEKSQFLGKKGVKSGLAPPRKNYSSTSQVSSYRWLRGRKAYLHYSLERPTCLCVKSGKSKRPISAWAWVLVIIFNRLRDFFVLFTFIILFDLNRIFIINNFYSRDFFF